MPCGHDNPFCPTPANRERCPAKKCEYPDLARMLLGCTKRPQSPAVPRAVVMHETPDQMHRRLANFI